MPTTFLDLPAELRNAIYDLYTADHKRAGLIVLESRSPRGTYVLPALSRVSRQVRQEFLSIWGPVNIYTARTLKVYIDDIDLRPLRTYLSDQYDLRRRRGPAHLFRDVQLVFRFTDARNIAKQAHVESEWNKLDFTWVSWRLRPREKWVHPALKPRLQPRMTYRVAVDWESLGGTAGPPALRGAVPFAASGRLLGDIVRRAREVQAQRPAGRRGQDRAFRTWLKLELDKEEHRPSGRGRPAE